MVSSTGEGGKSAFVYCEQLPFVCDPSASGGQFLLPFPEYCVVEIGTCNCTVQSGELARRLHDIMTNFPGETFTNLRQDDQASDVFCKGKYEERIVFIQKCCDPLKNVEDEIVQMGIKLDARFQKQFFKKDKPTSQQTWVLMRRDLMEKIKREYRSTNWYISVPPTDITYLDRTPFPPTTTDKSGKEFVDYLAMLCAQHVQDQGYTPTPPQLKITFQPTDFKYTIPQRILSQLSNDPRPAQRFY